MLIAPRFNNMKKELVAINLKKVNWVATILFVVPLLISLVIKFTLFKNQSFGVGFWDYLIIGGLCPLLLIAHEGLHAIGFLLGGATKDSVRFGAIPKKMMLYCTTTKPLLPSNYKFALVLPLIALGVVPLIISTILLDWKYALLFASMISGAGGDVMMLFELAKRKEIKLVEDHPKAPAFYAFYDEDSLPKNFKEVTDEDEIKLLESINSK